MKRLNKLRPMMIIVLISQLFFACANDQDEFLADNVEEVVGDYTAATIYYEVGSDKYAIVYHKNGDKKTFNNGKKVGQTQEEAPDPIVAPENAENVEIIEGEAWTDSEAIDQTANGSESSSQGVSSEVMYWKDMFDAEWNEDDQYFDREDAIAKSKSANKNQEYYFLAYYIDGLTQVWQATGDNQYLDTALMLINNTIDDAVDVGNGYKGWPAYNGNTYALWDSYYWRYVTTLTRIMHQSPNLRSQGDYQSQYEKLLNFSIKHIWDRWEADGADNFYRSRTHMSSHWARIGMELYIITGDNKYKSVFDKISFGQQEGVASNLRDQIFDNPSVPGAILWDSTWGVSKGSNIQDTSHAGAIVSFWVTAYENGMYWNQGDIDAITTTLLEVVWPDSAGGQFYEYVDGVGSYENRGRLHEWLTLGRYNAKIQSKVKNDYIPAKNDVYYGTHALGIAALNQKILEDGKPVYPEN